MILPKPSGIYDPSVEARRNRALEIEDGQNLKRGRDIELVNERLILRSPDGKRWAITVTDLGTIEATEV